MVKKRHAAFMFGSDARGGGQAYADASPRAISVRNLPFVSAMEYAQRSAGRFEVIEAFGARYTLQPSATIGENDAVPLDGRARTIYLARFDDAVVELLSYLLRAGACVIGDFEYDELERFDDCPELDAGLFAVRGNEAFVIDDADATESIIDEAFVSLLGPHSPHFGHWIWHQLPRLILALEQGGLEDMPILIERGMPPSHREALQFVIGDRDMRIVEMPHFSRVRVRHAWYAPMPFKMPYLPIPNERWQWSFIAPSPKRFKPILASMHKSVHRTKQSGRRIYLTRGVGLHRVLRNRVEIEDVFAGYGFEIIDPVKLTFAEQAAAVASADIVAGPEGSAMFLNFYRRPGTQLLILSHPFTKHLTNWTATLEARSIHTTIVTGPVVAMPEAALPPAARFGYNYFVDYEIEPAILHDVIRSFGIA